MARQLPALLLRSLNKARKIAFQVDRTNEDGRPLTPEIEGQAASNLVRNALLSPHSCMIARFGNTELRTVLRRWNRTRNSLVVNACRYALGRQGPFWWDEDIRKEVGGTAGFFPCTDELLNRFGDLYLGDLSQIDILATWVPGETSVANCFAQARLIPLLDLEPFYHRDPWTTALGGKTVLVVHPFEESIRSQYARREHLFADPRILPEFELKTLKAVQSIGGRRTGFQTWFDALDSMQARIAETQFDIALIGAGAYGMPLAAHVKRLGKKAVHLGGASQLCFGIKGKRWDHRPFYQSLYNEYWTRPQRDETPDNHQVFEDGCYW